MLINFFKPTIRTIALLGALSVFSPSQALEENRPLQGGFLKTRSTVSDLRKKFEPSSSQGSKPVVRRPLGSPPKPVVVQSAPRPLPITPVKKKSVNPRLPASPKPVIVPPTQRPLPITPVKKKIVNPRLPAPPKQVVIQPTSKPVVPTPKPVARSISTPPVATNDVNQRPAERPFVSDLKKKFEPSSSQGSNPVVRRPVGSPPKPIVVQPAPRPVTPAPRPVVVQPAPRPIVPAPSPAARSLLTPTQKRIAQVTGMNRLYSEGALGQGQKVAVVEFSACKNPYQEAATWSVLRSVTHKEKGRNYKGRFLSAPSNGKIPSYSLSQFSKCRFHGSAMAATVLDFSPRAQVLPINTWENSAENEAYYDEDALLYLSRRTDISVINISSLFWKYFYERYFEGVVEDDTLFLTGEKYKYRIPQKIIYGFKEIAKSGKIIVMAAGNQAEEIPFENARSFSNTSETINPDDDFPLFHRALFDALDKQTKKSIILAGMVNPSGRVGNPWTIDPQSNSPGFSEDMKRRFLFTPGKFDVAYEEGVLHNGTSNSAVLISATLANLLSKSEDITPRMAVKALMKTAAKRDPEWLYGRGLMRADKAAEWLDNLP